MLFSSCPILRSCFEPDHLKDWSVGELLLVVLTLVKIISGNPGDSPSLPPSLSFFLPP